VRITQRLGQERVHRSLAHRARGPFAGSGSRNLAAGAHGTTGARRPTTRVVPGRTACVR
jgi:hypothetical protein